MLRGHNPLGINSSSYSFDNFFFTSSLSFFLETQETCGYSPKLLFLSGLKKKKKKSGKVQESNHTNRQE